MSLLSPFKVHAFGKLHTRERHEIHSENPSRGGEWPQRRERDHPRQPRFLESHLGHMGRGPRSCSFPHSLLGDPPRSLPSATPSPWQHVPAEDLQWRVRSIWAALKCEKSSVYLVMKRVITTWQQLLYYKQDVLRIHFLYCMCLTPTWSEFIQ